MQTRILQMPAARVPQFARKHGITSLVLLAVLGLNLFAGISLLGFNVTQGNAVARVTPNLPGKVAVAPAPAPEPLEFRADVAPQDALAINAAVPISESPNPSASAFKLLARTGIDRARSVDCLTQAIYYEAATEPDDGKRAVAQVVLNRLRHPAYPNTVCGVVYQGSERATGCQFTFTCDGSLARPPMAPYWQRARKIAEEALAGKVFAPVGWATHYHTNWVVPYWSSSLVKLANVGTHIFYRWTGGWGRAPSFRDRHAGLEPDVSSLGRRTAAPVVAAELKPEDMTPEQLAALEKGPDGKPLPPSSVDSFQRAVLRRYEPMPGSAVKSLLASQANSADKAYSSTHVWAMSGEAKAVKPLGRPAADAARPLGVGTARVIGVASASSAEPKAGEPQQLEGVRKVEKDVQGPPKS